jgi:NAD(P)H-dependent FMN reductase
MSSTINLGIVYGSARQGRFCDTVARWAAAEIAGRDEHFHVDLIDPAQLPGASAHGYSGAAVTELKAAIGRADAFVIVTPEYNHAYPAALKALIDTVYDEWQAKPVAFISYGGVSGGLRAVEQLRLVFAELHAMTIRDTVSFANAHTQFDPEGRLLSPDRARRSLAVMLERLGWWATVLKSARAERPYRLKAA